MKKQPIPTKNKNKPIVDLVIKDMKERKKQGIKTYGVALQAFNGRNALQDAYEEALDLAIYLKQVMEESKIKTVKDESAGLSKFGCVGEQFLITKYVQDIMLMVSNKNKKASRF